MSLIAVIAGASRWPQCPELETNRSLAHSADQVAEYFLSPALQLRYPDLLFVFDDARSADELDDLLGKWLRDRQENPPPGGPITDVVFYYIGHGHRSNDALFLTVQGTRSDNLEQSSWSAAALAQTLRKNAPKLRKHVVLDCCYGGAAIAAFQKPDDAGSPCFTPPRSSRPR